MEIILAGHGESVVVPPGADPAAERCGSVPWVRMEWVLVRWGE